MRAVCLNTVLLGVLGPLLFGSRGLDGFVDAIALEPMSTLPELQQQLQTSFYVLGYCSDPASTECSSLRSLLESSEEFMRDISINTGLLHGTAYWHKHHLDNFNISTATNLWFACHDGQQIRMRQINFTEPITVAAAHASRIVGAFLSAATCDPDVPFYSCPRVPAEARLNLLMSLLAVAVQEQGTACIRGQMRNMHPAAEAVVTATQTHSERIATTTAEAEACSDTCHDMQQQPSGPVQCVGPVMWPLYLMGALTIAGITLIIVLSIGIHDQALRISGKENEQRKVETYMCGELLDALVTAQDAIAKGTPEGQLTVLQMLMLHSYQYAQTRAAANKSKQTEGLGQAATAAKPTAAAPPAGPSSGTAKQVSTAVHKSPAAQHPTVDAQQPAGNAQQPTAVVSTAPATAASDNSSNVPGSAGSRRAATAATGSGDRTAAAATFDNVTSSVSSLSETDRMRLSFAQMAEPITQAAATAAAAAHQGAANREAVARLQAQVNSMNSTLKDVSILAQSSAAAGAIGSSSIGNHPDTAATAAAAVAASADGNMPAATVKTTEVEGPAADLALVQGTADDQIHDAACNSSSSTGGGVGDDVDSSSNGWQHIAPAT